MSQPSTKTTIRHFQQEGMPLLGALYKSVTAKENATFWWVGDEENWGNVYCAFEGGRMVAKGQVSIINVVPPGRLPENKHAIYLNLKTVPEREHDDELLEKLYRLLYQKASELKQSLPQEYNTILCVGNDSTAAANNGFFIRQGFRQLNSLFRMRRELDQPVGERALDEAFQFAPWQMETPEEERQYLQVEAEIWPDTPLGAERLAEYKKQPLWTSLVIRQKRTLAAGLMAWQEEEHGVIEDVFVREPWRQRGFAKFLLTQGLAYLQAHGLPYACLTVLTTNQSALFLYESVGFYVESEEVRYFSELA